MAVKNNKTAAINQMRAGKRMQKIELFLKSLVIKFRDTIKSPANLYRFLGSRGLSVFSLGLLIGLYTVWLLPFQIYGIPSQVVKNIANKEWFFRTAYVLFFINALLCLLQSIPLNLRKIQLAAEIPDNDRFVRFQHSTVLAGYGLSPRNTHLVKALLRIKGYWTIKVSETGIAAFRGRFSPLGSILLHASFFLIPLGLLVSSYSAVSGYAVITEGQSFEGSNARSYVSLNPEKAKKNPEMLPVVSFRLDTVRPVFWRDKLLFTDLSASMTYNDNDTLRNKLIRLNSPWFVGGNFIGIRGFGYAPRYVITDKTGTVIEDAFVNLKIFPSGFEDSFSTEKFPYPVKVSVYSDYVRKNGKYETKSFNLANPIFNIKILDKKGRVLKEQFLLPGDTITYKGYGLMLPEIRYYGEFSVVKDYGIWFVFAALFFVCAGLAIKLLFYRKELFVRQSGHALVIAGRAEYFNRNFGREFENIVDIIKQKVK